MPAERAESETERGGAVAEDGLQSRGMRDLGPAEMRRFRAVERRFLDVAMSRGCDEIRTPTIEPLHLFTGAGTLSPQMLDRVYSFLDWDGWSGERVVLRPDSTVPAARWYGRQGGAEPARLCYVQPVYRFTPDGGEREIWQCGVELFGLPAQTGDAELLQIASEFVASLRPGDGEDAVRIDIAHAGLIRAVVAAAGLDEAEQLAVYDRVVDGDEGVVGTLAERAPELAPALQLLFDVEGGGTGYLANLRAALLPVVPQAATPIDELQSAVAALEASPGVCRVLPGAAQRFEYYTGITFRLSVGDVECVAGGRYDGLGERLAGAGVPACGFGADLLRLAELAELSEERGR